MTVKQTFFTQKGSGRMLELYGFSIDKVQNPWLVRCRDLRFGWKLRSDKCDVLQTAYRLTVQRETEVVFDSGVVRSAHFMDVSFDTLTLVSKTAYRVTLAVWDNQGDTATHTQDIITEILPQEWDAVWIKPCEHIVGWAPYLRTKFTLGTFEKAVIYTAGLGCASYFVNGVRVEDTYLDPPSTNYNKTVYYRCFDLTDYLQEGGNALAVQLGEGFYAQSRTWAENGLPYGDVCVKLRLEITLADGSVQVITTNINDWQYRYSPVTANNLYAGEVYDCRLETPDFALFEGSESGWGAVAEDVTLKGVLTPCVMPPVRAIRELPAVSLHTASGEKDGVWIFDIGENIAGVAEFHIPKAPRGAVYVFRYAETLNEAGALDVRTTGPFATQCIQQDMYICRGDEDGEIYRPQFTYHGFRYVEVTGFHSLVNGYGTAPSLSLVTGIQLATDLQRTHTFSCEHMDLQRLYDVMHNTYMSNFHGFPEDCPTREKCGWLGDAQIVCDFGLLNYDSASSYKKYLNDIRTTYETYGDWQQIAPGKRTCGSATALWGCAQVLIPYDLYLYTGDTAVVAEYFDLMEKWVQREANRAEGYCISNGLGDWIPPCGNGDPRRMPVEHSSTAVFYEVCVCMARLCAVVGKDPAYYTDLAAHIKAAFIDRFYDAENHTYGDWGTDAVALSVGLYPDGEYDSICTSLVNRIRADAYYMCTSIYGNKHLMPLLFKEGYGDVALRCLFDRNNIGFGWMLDDGATALYENLKAKKNGNLYASSLNHPMHGGFLCGITTAVCGITPRTAGFEQITFLPCACDALGNIKAEMELSCGCVAVDICKTANGRECILTVPAGTTAVVESSKPVLVDGVTYTEKTPLGSGNHHIVL